MDPTEKEGRNYYQKIVAFLLALTMMLSLAACGGGGDENDPALGKYIGVQGEMEGIVLTMEELYPGESYLEIKSGGKASLVMEGDKIPGTWKCTAPVYADSTKKPLCRKY